MIFRLETKAGQPFGLRSKRSARAFARPSSLRWPTPQRARIPPMCFALAVAASHHPLQP